MEDFVLAFEKALELKTCEEGFDVKRDRRAGG